MAVEYLRQVDICINLTNLYGAKVEYRTCSIICGEDKQQKRTIHHTYLTTGLIFLCTEYKLSWKKKNNFDRTGYVHHIWPEHWLTDGKQWVAINCWGIKLSVVAKKDSRKICLKPALI